MIKPYRINALTDPSYSGNARRRRNKGIGSLLVVSEVLMACRCYMSPLVTWFQEEHITSCVPLRFVKVEELIFRRPITRTR